MSVSKLQLHACRTCEHGRDITRRIYGLGQCAKGHLPQYTQPAHEHDDQHGYHRECGDHVQRAEVIDAEREEGNEG